MFIDKGLSIGQRFKMIRKEKGISQIELCDGICSNSVVSHIETDRQYPSAHIWGKLTERLGVPVYVVMGEQETAMDVNFQLDVIRVYIERGEYTRALFLIEELEKKDELLEHQRVELLLDRAECFLKKQQYREAVYLLKPFVENQEIQKSVDDESLCEAYNKLGNAHYWLNDFEKAYAFYHHGYRYSLGFPEYGVVSARITKNLGLTCHQLGFKEEATQYLEKAYEYYEQITDSKELANTLFYLALASGNVDYMMKARSIYESMNLTREANMAKQHYAFYVEAKVDLHKALQSIEACTVEFEKMGDVALCVYTLARAAMICVENEQEEVAERYLFKAEEFRKQLNEEDDYDYYCADYFKACAKYSYYIKNYDQAILNAKKSAEMCAKMGLSVESSYSLRIIAEAYSQQGMHEEAYKVSMEIVQLFHQQTRRE